MNRRFDCGHETADVVPYHFPNNPVKKSFVGRSKLHNTPQNSCPIMFARVKIDTLDAETLPGHENGKVLRIVMKQMTRHIQMIPARPEYS